MIVARSRSMTNAEEVAAAIAQSGFALTEVMSGDARGVDTLGEAWAHTHHIPVRRFPADWQRYGKSAGFRRNEAMAHGADALIAVWDGSSPGTGHVIATLPRQIAAIALPVRGCGGEYSADSGPSRAEAVSRG